MNTSAVTVSGQTLGPTDNTYIIAEIGSNFDGEKKRAKKLIDLAADCGADAAKFQAFKADKIVSQHGFDDLKSDFQEDWNKSVYETYRDAELPREWIDELASYTRKQGLNFLCTPYDEEAVDLLVDVGVPAFKIGSGDITWTGLLQYVAEQGLPVILATGASTLADIEQAVNIIESTGNDDTILLQCVTNYPSEFESANIRTMSALAEMFDTPVGYSDHTPGSAVPLGAVSRGACIIEKHFTDDKSRDGPDHSFAMNPEDFTKMVTDVRNLNEALGSPRKSIYDEEQKTVILQRRCLRAARDIEAGTQITNKDVIALRPAPEDGLEPTHRETVVGRTVSCAIPTGDYLTWSKL